MFTHLPPYKVLVNNVRLYVHGINKISKINPKSVQQFLKKTLYHQKVNLQNNRFPIIVLPCIITGAYKFNSGKSVIHCSEIKRLKLQSFNTLNWAIEQLKNIWIFFKLLLRCFVIVLLFQPFILFYPLTFLNFRLRLIWWYFLLRTIEISGPVLIKLGQWAATRRDLFPISVCRQLEKLQHKRKAHSLWDTKSQLNIHLGLNWEKYLEFDLNTALPVGSGCVAQVYKMWLNVSKSQVKLNEFQNERVQVAVKILHPGIKEAFERDIYIISFAAKLFEYVFKSLHWLDLRGCVDHFSEYMLSQIDLRHEAEMLIIFNKNFENCPSIIFPKPVLPYVTEGVLIENWQEGLSISKLVENESVDQLKCQTANSLIHMLLKMAFTDNLIHGDLHSGNILIRQMQPCETKPSKNIATDVRDVVQTFKDMPKNAQPFYQIVILDCGLSTRLNRIDYLNFLAVFRGVILDQGRDVGKVFLEHSDHKCPNTEAFLEEMEKLVHFFRQGTLSLQRVDVGDLLGKVFSLLITHRVKLESRYSSAMLAIMILEGLGRSLDPNIDLIKEAWPYLIS